MTADRTGPERYVEAIRQSGLSIYDLIEIGDSALWIPTPDLEQLLNATMSGISLAGLPLRTRSKTVKQYVCRSLGYPVPSTFKRTHPRFPGQCFDTYAQKSNNLQIWNEELVPTRRYVIIRIDRRDMITKIRVVSGNTLALLDPTGTLTQKYQARLIPGTDKSELVTDEDTYSLRNVVHTDVELGITTSPADDPGTGTLLPIRTIFDQLKDLIGASIANIGSDQERNRGELLHRLVCHRLGYTDYRDNGQFPDIRHQLLEVKLQTSPTIDLGLVCPNSEEVLDVPKIDGRSIRLRDVRYALFYAELAGNVVTLTHLFLSTGEKFFTRFPQFQGNVLNRKLQIPLPANLFD